MFGSKKLHVPYHLDEAVEMATELLQTNELLSSNVLGIDDPGHGSIVVVQGLLEGNFDFNHRFNTLSIRILSPSDHSLSFHVESD